MKKKIQLLGVVPSDCFFFFFEIAITFIHKYMNHNMYFDKVSLIYLSHASFIPFSFYLLMMYNHRSVFIPSYHNYAGHM